MRAPRNSIFICYRRADSADLVGRVYDYLSHEFGRDAVYRDVDTIPLGVNFHAHIEACLKTCLVGLVIVGPDWPGALPGMPQPRVFGENDHVRLECETMLATKSITAIPCFVRGLVSFPDEFVPESLRGLRSLNGLKIRPDPDFHNDIGLLINQIRRHLEGDPQLYGDPKLAPGAEESSRLSTAFVVVLILHVITLVGIYAFQMVKNSQVNSPIHAPATPSPRPATPK